MVVKSTGILGGQGKSGGRGSDGCEDAAALQTSSSFKIGPSPTDVFKVTAGSAFKHG